MPRRAKRLAAALARAVLASFAVAAIQGCAGSSPRSSDSPRAGPSAVAFRATRVLPPGAVRVTITGRTVGRPVPPGFLGLSLEFGAASQYAGPNPALFDQLIRNLDPGQEPVLRIGGDSTDWAWWPVPGIARPAGIRIDLGPAWLATVRRLAASLDARLILGLNFEADSRAVAQAEARAFMQGLGSRIEALELGNEPDLYTSFAWYRTAAGRDVMARPPSYGFAAFTRDFVRMAGGLPHAPLAGPALGTPPWTRDMGRLLAAAPRLSLLTLHRYPLQRCFTTPSSPRYPTISNLLAARSSRGLADALIPAVRAAHRRGVKVRLDEINSVACGGSPGVSDTFASALWALDVNFELARVGLDGVNFHTFPGAGYQLFSFDGTGAGRKASLYPEYYGLLMFAQGAPPGSDLLRSVQTGPGNVKVWATRDGGGTIRVTLINDSPSHAPVVALRLPATTGSALLEWLTAPSLEAKAGVTLGGRSFGTQTSTGLLVGRPDEVRVKEVGGRYVLSLPPASAALLTLSPPGLGASLGARAAAAR